MEYSPSEKQAGSHLAKKSPGFNGNQNFITAFTSARHLPYPDPDQSSPCHPNHFLKMHLNIILLSTPGPSK